MAQNAVKSLRRLSRAYPTSADSESIQAELRGDSDRAAAIMAATMLGEMLQLTIAARFRSLTDNENALLFDDDAPLATFSARTRLAYALSLVGPVTRSDIDKVREIRNAFAHSRTAIRFATPEIAAVCTLLRTPEQEWVKLRERADPRRRYLATAYTIGANIWVADKDKLGAEERASLLP